MTPPAPRILVADDQADVVEALRLLLKGEGFDVETTGSPAGVLHAAGERTYDAVLMDLNYARDTTSGREGLDLLAALRRADTTLPVVVMTAWGSVDGAVEAMRRGARDYIEKPWNNTRLVATLRAQVELGRALRRTERLEGENRLLRPDGLPQMIARAPAMESVVRLVERIAPSAANVLITGEHGTGKEVVARWLHGLSPRKDRPLVTVNAGGLAEGVFDSEMFGHVKGAFTDARTDRVGWFEMADGGTLFLDEIGNLSPALQGKLLRVLQTGELARVGSSRTIRVDVRLLAATNVDIAREVAEGRFREDLLYRINTVEIRLPPLRERTPDIAPLAVHFLAQASARYGKRFRGFTEAALAALAGHSWPGNVRELEHAIERAVLLAADGETIGEGDLLLAPAGSAGALPLEQMTLDEAERHLIRRALARSDGNVSRAAEALGLSRSALYRRLQQHGLAP
jgi:DNA-binding NtrC family response regulator